MKFAKELDTELVQEWRSKYFEYRVGKKKLNGVSRALRSINATPPTPRRNPSDLWHGLRQQPAPSSNAAGKLPVHSFVNRQSVGYTDPDGTGDYLRHADHVGRLGRPDTSSSDGEAEESITTSKPSSIAESTERYSDSTCDAPPNYGSLDVTDSDPNGRQPSRPPSLELPDPALKYLDESQDAKQNWRSSDNSATTAIGPANIASLLEGTTNKGPSSIHKAPTASRNSPHLRRTYSSQPAEGRRRPFASRLLSMRSGTFRGRLKANSTRSSDIPLEAYRVFDARKQEYFDWMDGQLEKIEEFYKLKEEQANERLVELRDQLHEMRDRRLEEVIRTQRAKEKARHGERRSLLASSDGKLGGILYPTKRYGVDWIKPIEHVFDNARGKPHVQFGPGVKALQDLGGSPLGPRSMQMSDESSRFDARRDSIRRPIPGESVPYRTAKRRLKLALQEFYRGLELLKSYALLNRTAFRKIQKKYDKTVNAHPTGRYMNEKVNKAWFVKSEVLDGHLHAVEDLYARYFERGNHKLAIGKLRSKTTRGGEFYGNVYRNGLAVGAGIVFGVQGLASASRLLQQSDLTIHLQTSYLLQIYGGYFLSLLLFLIFCLNCKIWNLAKINYVFIFEFDTHHHLDWRQLSELPSFFIFLEGIILWLNFNRYGGDRMFIYYPVILIGITAAMLFAPAKILYYRSRQWWLYSNWRLLLAGLYPVEFRDFFLGDMYCSQTYTMGNIELFFCLYSKHWNPSGMPLCNSQHSRLLGFFSTLPGIWRALQCLRRYYDTRNVFPHLVNAGKYSFTILFYLSLSLYRVQKTEELRAFFIFCATINSLYCSVWDLVMDWSLGNPYAQHPFLRDVLGYKNPWLYYAAMVIDPILRFNWIFYALFTNDLQHSAILSFLVSLSEILRRGMWTLFRVENEHCTNIGRFRASRDIPLPYELNSPSTDSLDTIRGPRNSQKNSSTNQSGKSKSNDTPARESGSQPHDHRSTSDLERQDTIPSEHANTRTRRSNTPGTPGQSGIERVGQILSRAHAQDFERKRKSITVEEEEAAHTGTHDISSDDEEEEDEQIGEDEEQEAVEIRRQLIRVGHRS